MVSAQSAILCNEEFEICAFRIPTTSPSSQRVAQIAKFMGPTWGPPGSCRPQMGPILAQWTLLSGWCLIVSPCWTEGFKSQPPDWRNKTVPKELCDRTLLQEGRIDYKNKPGCQRHHVPCSISVGGTYVSSVNAICVRHMLITTIIFVVVVVKMILEMYFNTI